MKVASIQDVLSSPTLHLMHKHTTIVFQFSGSLFLLLKCLLLSHLAQTLQLQQQQQALMLLTL